MRKDKVHQCKSCPWRATCVPEKDIPNYRRELAEGLTKTIRSGLETLAETTRHIMACHYSKPGAEFPCAGWLHNQAGAGNNIAMRLAVMTGAMPVPVVDGDQHEHYEDTLPCEPTCSPRRVAKQRRKTKSKQ